MSKDFYQNSWSKSVELDLQHLLELAVLEDTETQGDLTSRALIPDNVQGFASLHVREDGVVAGIQAVQMVLHAVDSNLRWEATVNDGAFLRRGSKVGVIRGPVLTLLTAERLVLNLLGRLSGIATLTRKYVEAVAGTSARIYDTRKTTLGWRRLEKYAVRCGGAQNHRTGLFDAILIKDNHIAFGRESGDPFLPADAVRKAREFLRNRAKTRSNFDTQGAGNLAQSLTVPEELPVIEIEVDTLEQLKDVLPAEPDIVLLDNMTPVQLREAVEIRNRLQPSTELEASGGITLQTVKMVAETGVERISVGALTHSAISLDLGLDWG